MAKHGVPAIHGVEEDMLRYDAERMVREAMEDAPETKRVVSETVKKLHEVQREVRKKVGKQLPRRKKG